MELEHNLAQPASKARLKTRHFRTLLSFVFVVAIPLTLIAAYLYMLAADQYASRVGFSVRSEETSSPTELLGGLVGISSATTNETDILFKFIHSQNIVEEIDREIDLVALFSKPEYDPFFAYNPDGTIEDLVEYWKRMVRIDYESRSGTIELRVNAFTSEDAQKIAGMIFKVSSEKINTLSAIARDDITSYSKIELNQALERLKTARQGLAGFRNETQIVDPTADLEGQMGLLASLQSSLSEALIDSDLLRETTRENDPRVRELDRKVAAIENRIKQERQKLGLVGPGDNNGVMSDILRTYEELSIDLEFAQQSYLAARASYDLAIAQSIRKTRYLAAYIEPTKAQKAEYPKRVLILSLVALFLTTGWFILLLLYYSIRDRP